jgi:dCTP deaminase
MILNDTQIKEKNSITPFLDSQVRHDGEKQVISYGVSSFGYDISLSNADIRIFANIEKKVLNPKAFNDFLLRKATIFNDDYGEFFILPANTCALGISNEHFDIAENTLGVCVGKSTYARCGIIINITPLEPGWRGILTIEISNTAATPCRIYLNEGIAQILFFEGDRPKTTYSDKKGKYQNQKKEVTLPKL